MEKCTSSHKGQKVKSYTLAFKVAAIDYHKDGHSKEETARHAGVDPKRIRDWVKNEENLKRGLEEQVSGSKAKRRRLGGAGRKAMSATMEEMLIDDIEEMRSKKLRVTRKMVQCKAEELFKMDTVLEEADRDIFNASKGWVYRFFKRHNITIRKKTATAQKVPLSI